MRVGSPPLQPLPLPVGLKAFLFDGGVITVEVFVRTDEQPRLCVSVFSRLTVCSIQVFLTIVYFVCLVAFDSLISFLSCYLG